MLPVSFPGSTEIKKPANMTDEECMSVWAEFGFETLMQLFQYKQFGIDVEIVPPVVASVDVKNFPFYLTAWKPNKEDIEAINRGEPIYVKTLSRALPPMSLFTVDENYEGNF